MARNVFSAVLEIDTRYSRNPTAEGSVGHKGAALGRFLRSAEQGFTQLNNGTAPSVANGDVMIFAAPEYYFAYPQFNPPDDHMFAYDIAESSTADSGCKSASAEYPDILLVPGTTLYKEGIARSDRKKLMNEFAAAVEHLEGVEAGESWFRHEFRAPTKALQPHGHGFKSIKEKRRRTVGYNQARVYFNGERVFTMNKIDNAAEFVNEPGGAITFVPGSGGPTFIHPAFPDIRVGIEVCADQGRGETWKEVADILIVVAATFKLSNTTRSVRPRGLIINADAKYQSKASGMRRAKMTDAESETFNPDATSLKISQALKVGDVRCQRKTL